MDALFAAAKHYLKEPLLNRIRQFLTVVKLANYSLGEDMQKVVQEDFVEMRKNNAEGKITADDLHTRLILGRLLSLSYGQQYLTKELWDHACKLENNRKAILASGR
ncbi:hypothetical protein J437_LFUL019597 [Ladona fulva]|nr:hypothetical protein J437_LFUL019597 [Ladona fulva]